MSRGLEDEFPLNYLLRVIFTLTHYSDIVSDMPSESIYQIQYSIYICIYCILTFYLIFSLASILTYFLAYLLTFFLAFYLASILPFFLASILTFYLTWALPSANLAFASYLQHGIWSHMHTIIYNMEARPLNCTLFQHLRATTSSLDPV